MKLYDNNKLIEYMIKDINNFLLVLNLFKVDKALLEEGLEIKNELTNLIREIELFAKTFNNKGWILSNSMNNKVIKEVIKKYESSGIGEAEKILINYYTKEESLNSIYSISKIKIINYANEWSNLIEKAFEYHLNKEYIASIPLFLLIIDGIMAKYNENFGFHSKHVNLRVKESFIYEQIEIVKKIYNTSRKKINNNKIYMPYRNGILHGKDLNYANEYVSSKLVNLFIGVLDWIDDKQNEKNKINELQERKETENKSMKEVFEEIKKYKIKIKKDDVFFNNWNPEDIIFNNDFDISKDNAKVLPENGKLELYEGYPYLQTLISFLNFWKVENYGYLAKYMKVSLRFKKELNDEYNHPGLVSKVFRNYKLIDYKLKSINLNNPAMKKITVSLNIETDEEHYKSLCHKYDKFIDVEFRIVSKLNYNSDLIYEQIKNSDWVIDSDLFLRLV